ncbi:MAG: FtsX-like permease family protein [Eubacterium sp.]
MNIVNKLTLRHLKENKSRTVITTLGICVSVAMITAVFVAMASFLNLFGDVTIIGCGDYHARFYDITQEQLSSLENDSRIKETGIYITPENSSILLKNRKTDRLGTCEILIGDEVFLSQMLTSECDGALPKNENEVAIEQSLLDKNGLDLKIGDKITFAQGIRYIKENGQDVSVVGDYYYPDEKFLADNFKEYTITAILHDNPATRFTPVFRGMSEEEKAGVVSASIQLSELNYKSLDTVKAIIKDYKISDSEINTDYLESFLAIDENSYIAKSLLPMAAIILVIIMIASVVLIYNAFGMSLSERIRYLGMLASVGATRKQKKMSVYYEGIVLGCIGIPVGIIAGIIGIGITLKAVGNRIISTGMILGVSDSNMEMKTVVPVWTIIGIILISILTIFISCFVPSRKASKITPIDAIRQSNEVKLKAKRLKSPKIIRKIFGYEGELAYKNLKRNGRKSRVITGSIALSIILFLSCNYFCSMLTQANSLDMDVPYQVQAMVAYSDREKFEEDIKNIGGIDNYYSVNNKYVYCGGNNEIIEKNFENKEYLTPSYKNLFSSSIGLFIHAIDDDDFNEICKANKIDYNQFYGEDTKCLILNDITHKGTGEKVFNNKIIGQHIKANDSEYTNAFDYEIGGLVNFDKDNYAFRLSMKNNLAGYIPLSQYAKDYMAQGGTDDINLLIGIETEKHAEVKEELTNLFEEKGYLNTYVSDYSEIMQMMNTLVFVIEVFVYGFISLITLITIANIINTISTNIQLRKKEFAMLKSVGTTPKGFRKMISLESVFYGLRAVIFGIPISVIISIVLNKTMSTTAIPFIFDWRMYLIVIAVVFAIIGITMLFSVSKLKDDSIVETLKEEIN